MSKIKIGFDIDGTVTDPGTFIPYLNQHFKKNITLDQITSYDLTGLLGITSEEFFQWMKEHEGSIYEQATIASYFQEAIKAWKEKHEFIYISARGQHLYDLTLEWFSRNNIPYHHLELIGSHNKIAAITTHQLDIFFEDKHDNACEIAEACSIPVILMDTPYNRLPVPDNVYRMENWQEALFWVNNWLKNQR
ncbi:5' nucleotidase, NT5C type [Bacillus alkalicellulosilyticus]|uniref:5' nucleotidase, NT5C type n=1 Tax=Alkalihalobacterium alkalicellulosilyticum TaxID=1912214 RepID=UPI000995F6D3|nr:hypothetical protein [Bacillus alkalicellulosilyticus]